MTLESDQKADEIANLNSKAFRLESAGAYLQSLSEIQRFRRIMKEHPGAAVVLKIGSGTSGLGNCMELELNDFDSVNVALEAEERSDMAELENLGIRFGEWS